MKEYCRKNHIKLPPSFVEKKRKEPVVKKSMGASRAARLENNLSSTPHEELLKKLPVRHSRTSDVSLA